jgi:hypothetical protein
VPKKSNISDSDCLYSDVSGPILTVIRNRLISLPKFAAFSSLPDCLSRFFERETKSFRFRSVGQSQVSVPEILVDKHLLFDRWPQLPDEIDLPVADIVSFPRAEPQQMILWKQSDSLNERTYIDLKTRRIFQGKQWVSE